MQEGQELRPAGWEIFDKKSERLRGRRYQREQKQKMERIVSRKRSQAREYTAGESLAMAAVVIACGIMVIAFLYQSHSLTQNKSKLSMLCVQYESLVSENHNLEKKIEAEIDYEGIYDWAVHELGMTYPRSDQIVTYERGDQSYVHQEDKLP